MKLLISSLLLAVLGGQSAFAQCPNDDTRGNNTQLTAWPLPQGRTEISGALIDPGGSVPDPSSDWFTFTLEPDKSISARALYNSSDVELYIQIFDMATQTLVAFSDPSSQLAFVDFENRTSSTHDYLMLVAGSSIPAGCGDYTLQTLITLCPSDDSLEDNDDCSMPFPLTDPDMVELTELACFADDDDWFGLTLFPGETFNAEIFFSHSRADLDLYLHDSTGGACSGGLLAVSDSTTNRETVNYTNSTAAPIDLVLNVDWYDTVSGSVCSAYSLDYSVQGGFPDDVYEDNDTLCEAGSPASLGVYSDLVVTDFDSDFYFAQTSNALQRFLYSIEFDHAAGDLDMRLWEVPVDCTAPILRATSDSTNNYEELEFEQSSSNSYFVIEVYYFPTDGGNNTYEMTIARGGVNDLGETVCFGESNSVNGSGEMYAVGSLAASTNALTLRVEFLPPNVFGFYNTSMGFGFSANPGGSLGNLCIAGGPIGRFNRQGEIINSGPFGTVDFSPDLTTFPQGNGTVAVQPGETWFFQLWYRDFYSYGGAASNFGSALRVRFE